MLNRPDNKIIIGKTGSGKTVKVMNLIADRDRLLIFDTMGHDYRDGVVFYDLDRLKTFWLKVYRESFRLIYRPTDELSEFNEICDLVWKCRNVTFVVEELSIFTESQRTPMAFKRILKQGRHRDIHFIGITQRPVGIDRNVTAQASEICVFATDEPRDIKYLQERLGDKIAELLQQLEPYQYIIKRDGSDQFEIARDRYGEQKEAEQEQTDPVDAGDVCDR
jgi:hypothetical protein